jgi:ribosomal 50S subunit-recycling heat shock protein
MRLDKFLKVSRLIRQRPRAKLLCDQNSIRLNGNPVKASHIVRVGDIVQITIGDRQITGEVLLVPEGPVPKNMAGDLFLIRQDIWLNED